VMEKSRVNALDSIVIKSTNEWYRITGSRELNVNRFRLNGEFYQCMVNVKIGIDWTTGCWLL